MVAFIALWTLGFGLLVIISVFSSGDEAPKVKENTLLHLKLNAPIEERATSDPFAGIDFISMEPTSALGMNDLMLGLETAAKDDHVSALLIDMGPFSAGYGHLEELGDYLSDFQAAGKKIYTYGEYYTQKGAYLAALADSALLHPGGIMDLRGVGVSITYYKDFFDKYGIEPVVVRGTGNDYKSAVEPYISNEMSEANRSQLTALIGHFWNVIKAPFNQRGLSDEDIDRIANEWTGMDPEALLKTGAIDGLGYREDVMDYFEERYEVYDWEDYSNNAVQEASQDRIALIYANGTIGNGSGDEESIGTKNIVNALKKAEENSRVKAIVLRVNSPGGSALTSDIIHHAIEAVEKPVVVSQANYAASGGYYISCNADAIFTNSSTITGSIGIFMQFFSAAPIMNNTLGLKIEEVSTHPLANYPNLYSTPTPEAYALLQRTIDQGYDDFTGKVAAGRDTTVDYIKSIAKGRVWTGSEALSIGLADREGNLRQALDYAAELAEVESYRIYELPAQKTEVERIMELLGTAKLAKSNSLLKTIQDHPALKEVEYLLNTQGMQAKLNPIFSQF